MRCTKHYARGDWDHSSYVHCVKNLREDNIDACCFTGSALFVLSKQTWNIRVPTAQKCVRGGGGGGGGSKYISSLCELIWDLSKYLNPRNIQKPILTSSLDAGSYMGLTTTGFSSSSIFIYTVRHILEHLQNVQWISILFQFSKPFHSDGTGEISDSNNNMRKSAKFGHGATEWLERKRHAMVSLDKGWEPSEILIIRDTYGPKSTVFTWISLWDMQKKRELCQCFTKIRLYSLSTVPNRTACCSPKELSPVLQRMYTLLCVTWWRSRQVINGITRTECWKTHNLCEAAVANFLSSLTLRYRNFQPLRLRRNESIS